MMVLTLLFALWFIACCKQRLFIMLYNCYCLISKEKFEIDLNAGKIKYQEVKVAPIQSKSCVLKASYVYEI